LSGLGALSEARQFLFAALLLADQLLDKRPAEAAPAEDPLLASRADALARRLESLAAALEDQAANP
jgi:cell division protein ZapA